MSDNQEQAVAVLALNPAVDISYEIPQLLEYQKVCASRTSYYPGGNGINVARALTELGVPVHCCSTVGGESGDLLLRLLGDTLGDNHNWFRLQGETRLNTNIMQQNPPGQFEITSLGPEIPADVLAGITGCFLKVVDNGFAVLTGLIPPGMPDSTYRELAEKVSAQGGKVVLDASATVLEQALEAKPYLVRLNRYALEMNCKRRLDSIPLAAEAARALQQDGIEYLCVSLGGEGAILSDSGNSYHCSAPKVHKQSTVGSGDSLVAGLIAGLREGASSEDMLRLGVMCGSSTAAHPGTELFTRGELDEGLMDLQVTCLDI
ncbi:MAG TPA: carbohydrate kinase [Gammaproteobacteria bacterium]|nr:carbohydrate kinase [Gammaproteobacteria bacterium]